MGWLGGSRHQKDTSNAYIHAEIDAKNDVNRSLWVKAGFTSGILANKLANSLIPKPRIENILGRSDDYIIAYNDCYKKEAQKLQNSYKRIGWCGQFLIGTAINFFLYPLNHKKESSNNK